MTELTVTTDAGFDPRELADIDSLAKAVVEGRATITRVRRNACRCGGTYRSNCSPNWMNRWTCDGCGKHVSR